MWSMTGNAGCHWRFFCHLFSLGTLVALNNVDDYLADKPTKFISPLPYLLCLHHLCLKKENKKEAFLSSQPETILTISSQVTDPLQACGVVLVCWINNNKKKSSLKMASSLTLEQSPPSRYLFFLGAAFSTHSEHCWISFSHSSKINYFPFLCYSNVSADWNYCVGYHLEQISYFYTL